MTLPARPPPQQPKLRDDLIFRQVEDEFVVYDPMTDRTALLNASAALVLDLCDAVHSLDDIAHEVATAFSTKIGAVRAEVESAVNDFVTQGWIVNGGGTRATDHRADEASRLP